MPLYDLMLLLDSGAPTDRQEAILRDVQGLLESNGKLVGDYDWGSRRMTFEIDHRPDAAYHLFQFETEGGPTPLDQVDHSLKIMDGVLRHRIIRLKDGAPPPPMPQPERRGYGDYEAPAEASAAAATSPEPAEASAADATSPEPAGESAAAATSPAPAEASAADATSPEPGGESAPDAPEGGQPADAPAVAGTAAAEQPATPADAPAPAPAETPPAADQEAGPAGGGGDDVAPSGPTAA